jgi:hypothetical protein
LEEYSMRRSFVTLALAGLLGSVLLVGDAEACHKKKRACPPPCPPAPCAVPAPCPPPPCPPPPCYEPAPCPPPKKKCCGGGLGLFKKKHRGHHGGGCGAPAPTCYSGC